MIYTIPVGEWVKVASNHSAITMHNKEPHMSYLYTCVPHGGDIPTGIEEGAPLFPYGERDAIAENSKVDFYVTCVPKTHNKFVIGKVKVDV